MPDAPPASTPSPAARPWAADALLALAACAVATSIFVGVALDVTRTSGVSFAEVVTTIFDGEKYVEISQTGYRFDGHYDHLAQQNLTWPPGWPLALRLVSLGGLVHPGLAGFVLNALLLLLNTFLISREVRARTGSSGLCLLVAGTYALHPYGEFQLAPFSEPLFVTQTLGFLALVRARRWWLAALVAGLACGTRSAGLAFAPTLALLFILFAEGPRLRRVVQAFGLGLVSMAGQLAYLGYSWLRFGDFLAPHRIQQISHGKLAAREVPWAMLTKMASPFLHLGSWTKDVRLPGTLLVDLLIVVAAVVLVRALRNRGADAEDLWGLGAAMSVLWMLPLILLMNVGFVSPSNGRYSITLWLVLVPFAPLLLRATPARAQRLALPALALGCLTLSLVWFAGMTSNTLHGLAPF